MSDSLPPVLDLLVVGGGPAGTAAAFRAKELGLDPLVIEHDDVLKRIRDYSKDKLILPGFGGGDQMRFPKGGELISSLQFAPIDKDDMCRSWKQLYERFGVRRKIGVELQSMELDEESIWNVSTWDHTERQELSIRARHVVLAIGRGVPRTFDIPGPSQGIAFRLRNAKDYVGRPACVIGGGTSAAEAVIAISKAKAAAQDPTDVSWSYRGDKMPRVSKALSEAFFDAYVHNGNIRYHPRSEPAAVVVDDDRREYLSVRVDRRRIEGRPHETTHLEFPKEDCIACIGEDLPESLLCSCGVELRQGGRRNKKRMVVNRYLETCRPNLYLIGDILSQVYLETDDFSADPSNFREVQHRGNIKTALRDGVLVAQVVQQRLEGVEEIDIDIADSVLEKAKSTKSAAMKTIEVDRSSPGQSISSAALPQIQVSARLVRILPGGIEEEEYPLASGSVFTLGREGCDASFPTDTELSPSHASISAADDGFSLRDDGAETGVFLRIPSRRKLEIGDGDLIQAGRQFLLLRNTGGTPLLIHFDAQGQEKHRYPLPMGSIVLGRTGPDGSLDPSDRTLSRRQFAVTYAQGKFLIKDLESSNGTYLRVRGSRPMQHGDQFRIGHQQFEIRFDDEQGAEPPEGPSAPVPEVVDPPTVDARPSVTFRNLGKTIPVSPGQTLCEAAEAAGLTINAECHAGICGSDPIRILAGAENLAGPPDEGESDTLQDLCDLEPGPCRLACMTRILGPVEVELVE